MNTPIYSRVTSLEQLSLAEIGGEQARPKVYESGNKTELYTQAHTFINKESKNGVKKCKKPKAEITT
jgi:hypothetical protein